MSLASSSSLLLALSVSCATVVADTKDVVGADGGDRVFARERFPAGAWVPLRGPLRQRGVTVSARVDGEEVEAAIDSGASRTMMSMALAERLGLGEAARNSQAGWDIVDAHGATARAVHIGVAFVVGPIARADLRMSVVPGDDELLLIGADVLSEWELLIVADEGVVGFFPPGAGPRRADDLVVPAALDAWQRLWVDAHVQAPAGTARAKLLVDTGAWTTTFPSAVGVAAGLPADVRFKTIAQGILSEEEKRGRFLLRPLYVGDVDVGDVTAFEDLSGGGVDGGVVGDDVLLRFETLLVMGAPAQVRLHRRPDRPALRSHGPAGRCADGRCIALTVRPRTPDEAQAPLSNEAMDRAAARQMNADIDDDETAWLGRDDHVCLHVDVAAAWAGHKLELLVTDAPGQGSLGGGALTVVLRVPPRGHHKCLPLPRATQVLGLKPGGRLSLRTVRVDDASAARCDDDSCVWWSGM